MIYKITEVDKAAIEKALDSGRRVEIIPTAEGIKLIKVTREVLKKKGNTNGRKTY